MSSADPRPAAGEDAAGAGVGATAAQHEEDEERLFLKRRNLLLVVCVATLGALLCALVALASNAWLVGSGAYTSGANERIVVDMHVSLWQECYSKAYPKETRSYCFDMDVSSCEVAPRCDVNRVVVLMRAFFLVAACANAVVVVWVIVLLYWLVSDAKLTWKGFAWISALVAFSSVLLLVGIAVSPYFLTSYNDSNKAMQAAHVDRTKRPHTTLGAAIYVSVAALLLSFVNIFLLKKLARLIADAGYVLSTQL